MLAAFNEWLFVIIFIVCFFLFTVSEIVWLNRNGYLDVARSFIFAFTSNILAITIGFFVSFVLAFGIFMVVMEESMTSSPDATIWTLTIVGAIFPIALLVFTKRILRALLKSNLTRRWLYSLAASITFFLFVLGVPILIWKVFF